MKTNIELAKVKEETITWDEFQERYKPQQNTTTKREEFNGWLYETYGEDEQFIFEFAKAHPDRVWTILDVGYICIGNGMHHVNRFGYIITEMPCPINDFITVEDEDDKEDAEEEEERINKLSRPTEY